MGIALSNEFDYHAKQKDVNRSIKEELLEYRNRQLKTVEEKTEAAVNALPEKELYHQMRERLNSYRQNFDLFCPGALSVDKYAIDRDPLLKKFQKTFYENAMEQCKSNVQISSNITNSYSGSGNSPQFMIRALSYIYPLLIIQPLPEIDFRNEFPMVTAGMWSNFLTFITGYRVTAPSIQSEDPVDTDSGIVDARFGEASFENYTIRQNIQWASTVKKMQDETLNNGLINYVYMESVLRGFEQAVNDIYLSGLTDFGTKGLLNNPNIPEIFSAGSWAATNPATGERYSTEDMINLVTSVAQQSNNVFRTERLMLSFKLEPIAILPRTAYTSTSAITYTQEQLQRVQAYRRYENVFEEPQFKYNVWLNDKGTAGKQVAVAYAYNVKAANIGLPVWMYAEPVTFNNHKYTMPFLCRTSGFNLIQSKSIAIMRDIVTT